MSRLANVAKLVVAVVLGIMTAGTAIAAIGFGKYEKVKGVNGTVTIPMAKVSDGETHFFKIAIEGKEVAFFLVKATDGSLKSSFDACDVCYKEKKGYEQKGDAMLCRNCNKKFAIGRMGPQSAGGCNPSWFPHTVSGANVVIKVEDLKAGKKFF